MVGEHPRGRCERQRERRTHRNRLGADRERPRFFRRYWRHDRQRTGLSIQVAGRWRNLCRAGLVRNQTQQACFVVLGRKERQGQDKHRDHLPEMPLLFPEGGNFHAGFLIRS